MLATVFTPRIAASDDKHAELPDVMIVLQRRSSLSGAERSFSILADMMN